MRLMNHSPRLKTDAPNHDDMNTPIRNMKVIEVMNPKPIHNKFQIIIAIAYKNAYKHQK